MGMDVYGKEPRSPAGEYFRNSIWSWRPLLRYVREVAPDVVGEAEGWDYNDGAGLDADGARKLAARLRDELAAGRTRSFEQRWRHEQELTPDEDCRICAGTGRRLPPPDVGAGELPCNGCASTGRVRPWSCAYPFSVENVEEFTAFLEECGGFEIN
jgi:hypothetical protein